MNNINIDAVNANSVIEKNNAHTSQEFKLACSVVLQALVDCRTIYRRYGLDKARRSEPYVSLAYPLTTMRVWCDIANIDPDAMAERFRSAMQSDKTAKPMFDRMTGYRLKVLSND